MIIKLPLMLHNIVSKQFKISHVPCDVIAFKKEEIPSNISKLIEDQYDEKFLEDCDTVLFIKGPIDKELRKKIFKACDKALGEGANMMNETDFRLLKLHDDDEADFGGEDDQTDEEKIDNQVADIVNEPDDNTDGAEDDADDEAEDNGDAVEKSLASESLEDNSIMSAVVQGKSISQWVDAFKGEFTGNQLWKMANSGTDLQQFLLASTGASSLEDSELNEAKSSDEEDSNDEDSKEDEDEEDSDSEDDEEEDDDSDEDDKEDDSDDNESEEDDEEEPVVPTRYVFLKISMKG